MRKGWQRTRSAGGRFFGFFTRHSFTNRWKSADHLVLSFSVGGLYPLFDMRKRARMGCRSNMGGCSSANSMAVMPTAQMSQRWL